MWTRREKKKRFLFVVAVAVLAVMVAVVPAVVPLRLRLSNVKFPPLLRSPPMSLSRDTAVGAVAKMKKIFAVVVDTGCDQWKKAKKQPRQKRNY